MKIENLQVIAVGTYFCSQVALSAKDQLGGIWIDQFASREIRGGPLKTFVEEKARQIGINRPVVLFTLPGVHDFSVHGCSLSKKVGIALPDPQYTTELESRFFLLHSLHWIKNDSALKAQTIPFISMIAITILLDPNAVSSWLAGLVTYLGTSTIEIWYEQKRNDLAAYHSCTREESDAVILKMKRLAEDRTFKAQFGNYKRRAERLEEQRQPTQSWFSLTGTIGSVWKATTGLFTRCRKPQHHSTKPA